MLRYHLGWEDAEGRATEGGGGKGLRPALCLLACEAAGGDWRRALPTAAAVELVHNFSLIHDDIQDRDPERHRRPTVWSVWGDAQAINAGDALLSLARLAVLRLREEGLAADLALEAARVLDERTLEMVEGQTMDLTFESEIDVSIDDYISMIEKKSGALFDASLALGALAAGDPGVAEGMGRCGRLLGTAFQIRDDMLGTWGEADRTGKSVISDIRRRKKSLPIVYALSHAGGRTLHDLRRIYSEPELTENDVAPVLSHLEAVGARRFCVGLAGELSEKALAELAQQDLKSTSAAQLTEVAAFLLERDF